MTPVKKTIHFVSLLLLLTIAIINPAVAQLSTVFKASFKDSLVANKQNRILYNAIAITNTGNDTLVISGRVVIPTGWRTLTGVTPTIALTIPPQGSGNVSVNLMKQNSTPATWQQVQLLFWEQKTTDTQKYSYNIKAEAQPAFRVERTTEDIVLTDRPDIVHLGVHLKNTGNVQDEYTLKYKNANLDIEAIQKIKIDAGKDTVYYFPLKINNAEWKKLYKETINLHISATNNVAIVDYKVSRPQSSLRQHESAYSNIPIAVEGGAMVFGNTLVYTYGGRGLFRFGEHSLNLSYRSRQFGAVQSVIQRDVFNAEYAYRNWKVQAGQVSASDNFMTIGNGARIIYSEKSGREFSIAGVIHDASTMSIFQSDGLLATARYNAGKYKVTQTAELNSDKVQKIDGATVNNSVQIIDKEKFKLDANIGAGIENNKMAPEGKQIHGDLSFGYHLNYSVNKWDFNSMIDFHGRNFPGFRKGMNNQLHTATYKFGRTYLGALYGISNIKRNYFRDTLYNTDVMAFNNSKYGLQTGYADRHMNLNLSSGIFKQHGSSSIYILNRYYYADMNYFLKFNKSGSSSLTLTSQNVFSNVDGSWISSDMLQFNTPYGGLSGVYVRTPIIGIENNKPYVSYYSENFNGGPYVSFSFFKKSLHGNIRYMVSKTLRDNYTRTGIETNINYSTLRTGTNIQLSSYMPLKDNSSLQGLPLNQTRYAFLAVSQQLKVPVVTHRKYYDLKVVVFYDANSNNKKDANEQSLRAVDIGINDEILLTDVDGIVEYENIKQGSYKLDLMNAHAEDLVPVEGPIQSLVVNSNTTYEVPFKKGKVINGSIKVINDSFSTAKYNANLIKVTATDTNSRAYATLTDESGNFTIYVPEGLYTVSLNEGAYADTDFKPAQVSYTIDLLNHENSFVVFEIRQKKRKVRYLSSNQ